MVIACPNCKRKYQIDTTRIPVGGTSFTCWSCRATVRVDPLGNTDASGQSATPPSRPAIPGRESLAALSEPDSNVPPSAMRFFESLAAEATLTRQMAAEEAAQPEPEPSQRSVTGNFPIDALERLQGDDVLDLPAIEPLADAAVPVGDVIDLGLNPIAPEAVAEELAPPMPDLSDDAAMRTAAFGSPTAAEIASAVTAQDIPVLRPSLPSLSLPPSIAVPPPMPEPAIPELEPVPATDAFRAPSRTPDPSQSVPTEPFDRLGEFRPEAAADLEEREVPADVIPVGTRMTAAEMAVNPQRAWVAPEVQAPPQRSRSGLLALAAILLVAVSLVFAWQFVLKDFFLGRSSTTSTRTAPAVAPAPSSPTVSEAPQESPKPAESQPASNKPAAATQSEPSPGVVPTTAAPASPAASSGSFTVQIRSSPNEADARAFADMLKSSGFDAYVMRADLGSKGIWFRVRVGRFQTREEALREVGKLRSTARVPDAIIQPFVEN